MKSRRYTLVLPMLLLVATASAHPLPQRNAQGLLVGSTGHTLYTYDPDGSAGASQCNGSCAALWPPYAADPGARARGDYRVITRVDGSRQWAYRGHPLYLYAGDGKPGDTAGNGINGVWHVVH